MKKMFSNFSDFYDRRAPAIRLFTFIVLEVFLLVIGSYGFAALALLLLPFCLPSVQEIDRMDPFNYILGTQDNPKQINSLKLYFLQGDNREKDGYTNFWAIKNEIPTDKFLFLAYMDTKEHEGRDFLEKSKVPLTWSKREMIAEDANFRICFFMCPSKALDEVVSKLVEMRKIIVEKGYENYGAICQKFYLNDTYKEETNSNGEAIEKR